MYHPEGAATRGSGHRGSIIDGGNINGNASCCVFDRLVAAGKEAEQRKAVLGKMTPPGCTFQPQARGGIGLANPLQCNV